MCRSDYASFYDPDWEYLENEKIVLRRDLEADYADSINDEDFLNEIFKKPRVHTEKGYRKKC